MDFKTVYNLVNQVLEIPMAGWSSEKEAKILYDYASKSKGHVVELGSYMGRSTVLLSKGAETAGQKVIAIDNFTGPSQAKKSETQIPLATTCLYNLQRAGVLKDIFFCISDTAWAATYIRQEGVGLLFIDAGHDYNSVTTDFYMWYPSIINDGYILFHDLGNPSVRDAVREFKEEGFIHELETHGRLLVAQKQTA